MDILLFELPTVSHSETVKLQSVLDDFSNIMEWEVALHPANCLLTIKGIGIKAMDIIGHFKQQGILVAQVFRE